MKEKPCLCEIRKIFMNLTVPSINCIRVSKNQLVSQLEQDLASLRGELESSQEKLLGMDTELQLAKKTFAATIPGNFAQRAHISKISSDNISLRAQLITEKKKYHELKNSVKSLMENLPNFPKLPPIVTKLDIIQKTPSKEELLKVRDMFPAVLTCSMIQLSSDISGFQSDLKRISLDLETYQEQAA